MFFNIYNFTFGNFYKKSLAGFGDFAQGSASTFAGSGGGDPQGISSPVERIRFRVGCCCGSPIGSHSNLSYAHTHTHTHTHTTRVSRPAEACGRPARTAESALRRRGSGIGPVVGEADSDTLNVTHTLLQHSKNRFCHNVHFSPRLFVADKALSREVGKSIVARR